MYDNSCSQDLERLNRLLPCNLKGCLIYFLPQLQHGLHDVIPRPLHSQRHQAFLKRRAWVDILDDTPIDGALDCHLVVCLRCINLVVQERKWDDVVIGNVNMLLRYGSQLDKFGILEDFCHGESDVFVSS